MALKQKHIEASREARLWIGQIIVPVVSTVMIVSPEAREWTIDKAKKVINSVKSKFSK